MKTETKHSLLVWAVVALIVLNLSTLATIYYQRIISIKGEETKTNTVATDQSQEDKFSGRYFREKLSLTPQQMREFQKFNPVFRSDARTINIKLSGLRNEMLNELASENPDRKKLDSLSDSIGLQHSRLKHITSIYYLNIKSICNSDQTLKLKELFTEAFGSDSQGMPQNMMGRRGPYRGGIRK